MCSSFNKRSKFMYCIQNDGFETDSQIFNIHQCKICAEVNIQQIVQYTLRIGFIITSAISH